MMDMIATDISRAIEALEYFITDSEMDLIDNHQGGDARQWNQLNEYKDTLNNLKLLRSIYHG